MRKVILIIFLFLSLNEAFSQSVTIITPNKNSKFEGDEKITVAWEINESDFKKMKDDIFVLVKNKKGSDTWDSVTSFSLEKLKEKTYVLDTSVKFDAGIYQLGFKESCAKLPFSISNGFFEVKEVQKTAKNENKDRFSKIIKPKITFVSPTKDSVVKVGHQFEIKWDYKDGEAYEDSIVYLFFYSSGLEPAKETERDYYVGWIKGIKPILLKDKSFNWTLSDSLYKTFKTGTGVFKIDFDFYYSMDTLLTLVDTLKDKATGMERDTSWQVDTNLTIKRYLYSYSPEFKILGSKYTLEKTAEVGLSFTGAFQNTSALTENSNSTVSGGVSLYGKRYSSNPLGEKIPFVIFSGHLNLITSHTNDSATTKNFGSTILDFQGGQLSFGLNFLIRPFLQNKTEFFQHLGIFSNVGFSHQNWKKRGIQLDSQATLSAMGVDLGIQYDIFGHASDTSVKEKDLRLTAFLGCSLRKIFGDIVSQQNDTLYQSIWGSDKTFYIGPTIGLTIEFKDIALTGKFLFFDRDGVKEVPGFTGGQLVTTFSIRTNLFKGFFNL